MQKYRVHFLREERVIARYSIDVEALDADQAAAKVANYFDGPGDVALSEEEAESEQAGGEDMADSAYLEINRNRPPELLEAAR